MRPARPALGLGLALALVLLVPTGSAVGAPLVGANIPSADFLSASSGFELVNLVTYPPLAKLYLTTDGAANWRRVPLNLKAQPPVSGQDALPAAVSFASPTRGAVLVGGSPGACQWGFALDTTVDGGRTWRAAGVMVGSDGPTALAAAVDGPAWVLNGSCAGDYATLYRQSGQSLVKLHVFAPAPKQAKLYFADTAVAVERLPHGAALVEVAYSGPKAKPLLQGYQTTDGGARWAAFAIGSAGLVGTVRALAMQGTALGLAETVTSSGHGALYRTTDGGRHWTAVSAESFAADGVSQLEWAGPTVAYALVQSVLWRSTDAGATWTEIVPTYAD